MSGSKEIRGIIVSFASYVIDSLVLGPLLISFKVPENPLAGKLVRTKCENMSIWSWPEQNGDDTTCDGDPIWMSRLRSGHSPNERKSARWTTDTTFRYTKCTHERLLSTSPETYFHEGKPYDSGSIDFVIVDTSSKQDYNDFLQNIVDVLGSAPETPSQSAADGNVALDDKALHIARQLFREMC